MSEPTRIATGWFAVDANGLEITRPAVCQCGAGFTQRILSEKFLKIAEEAHAVPALAKQIPGFWCPVFCPPCERKDIGWQSRMVEIGRGAA